MINWKAYFDTQAAIRAAYEQKARALQLGYVQANIAQPTTDILVQMARQNRLYADLEALNQQCEAELARVEKPEGVRV